MSKKVCSYLSLAAGLCVLGAGCSRHSKPIAGTRSSENSHALSSPPASTTATPFLTPSGSLTTPGQAGSPQLVSGRPSPFSSPQLPQQPNPQAAVGNPSANATRSAAKQSHRTKSFTPPATLVPNLAGVRTNATLPAPPAIGASAPNVGLPFAGTIGSTATATWEAPNPTGVRRIINKLPGLRKRSVVAGGKEFVPPQPAHELQFVLPPGGVPALARKKQIDVKASVDASGHVTRVELLSPRDEELVTLAAYAANHWSFVPARLDEQPVPSEIILHFHFDSNPAAEEIAGKSKLTPENRCLASTSALPGQVESCK